MTFTSVQMNFNISKSYKTVYRMLNFYVLIKFHWFRTHVSLKIDQIDNNNNVYERSEWLKYLLFHSIIIVGFLDSTILHDEFEWRTKNIEKPLLLHHEQTLSDYNFISSPKYKTVNNVRSNLSKQKIQRTENFMSCQFHPPSIWTWILDLRTEMFLLYSFLFFLWLRKEGKEKNIGPASIWNTVVLFKWV